MIPGTVERMTRATEARMTPVTAAGTLATAAQMIRATEAQATGGAAPATETGPE